MRATGRICNRGIGHLPNGRPSPSARPGVYRVAMVEGPALRAALLRRELVVDGRFHVVARHERADRVLARLRDTPLQFIIVDSSQGLSVAARVQAAHPEAAVIVLDEMSVYTEDEVAAVGRLHLVKIDWYDYCSVIDRMVGLRQAAALHDR